MSIKMIRRKTETGRNAALQRFFSGFGTMKKENFGGKQSMKNAAKKITAALLVVVMVFALAACSGGNGSKGPEVKYTVSSIEADGMKLDPAALGMDTSSIYIQFNADGTGELSAMGETESFTWEGNKMTSQGETVEFQFSGNTVTVEDDGTKMIFTK